jgi:hypothetical protein
MGIAGEQFVNGHQGSVVAFGKVTGIQTNGGNYSQTWADETIIYAGTNAVKLTSVKPSAPNPIVEVLAVVNAHASNGTVFVRPNYFTADVFGPSSVVDNAIARFDGTTGKLIQTGGITIADGATGTLAGTNSGDVTLAGTPAYLTIANQVITRNQVSLTAASAHVTGTLPVANGGTGQTALSSIDAADLGSGDAADNYVLTADGSGGAAWEAASGGGGSSITGTGFAYVRSGGNNSTAVIGNPSLPYLTAQAAWNAGARKFELGAGSYSISHTSTSGTTPEEFVFVQGIGKEFCSLSITWDAPDGTPGTSSGAFQQTGGNGEQPSKLNLQSDSTVALSLSLSSGDGGAGGNGDAGTSEVPGGNGSDGGTGGNSPEFKLSYCYLASFSCVAGLGGEGGTGGIDNGAGAGSDGLDGAVGTIIGGRFEWCDVTSTYAPDSQDIFYASTVEGVGRLVFDGNKGDITVAGGGDSWSINSGSVTLADLYIASGQGKIIGRKSSGSGSFEECVISDFIQVAATASNITDTIGAATPPDISGMSFAIASNEKVSAIFRGFWATNTSGSGFKYSFTGPASTTAIQIGDFSLTSATAGRTEAGMTAFNTVATQGGATLLNSAMPIMIQIFVHNGGSPGTVQLKLGGEVAGSTFTLYRGFTMQVLRIP